MGFASGVPENVACVKGWIPYGLDEISKGAGARGSSKAANLAARFSRRSELFLRQIERVFDTCWLTIARYDEYARPTGNRRVLG